MASKIEIEPHVIVIPLMSQSHLIPMIDLSKLLAQRGLIVTIITTPRNALRYQATIDRAISSGLCIQLVPLPFPCNKAGLPEGCENLDSLPSPNLQTKFLVASSLLQAPLENYLERMNPKPSCIISSLPWTSDVAHKFNVPRFAYQSISCFTLLCSHNMMLHNVHENTKHDNEPFLVPDVPDKIKFTYAQLPKMMRRCSPQIDDGVDMKDIRDQFTQACSSAEGLLVNTFEELEFEYVKSYEKAVMRNVFCVGPLSLCNKMDENNGKTATVDEHYCLRWLDSMKSNSVIYVCFGSLCHLRPKQLIELGKGLEASNCPFIWIIRDVDYNEEIVKWIMNENFEHRVKGKGLIIKGWAPQVLILSHPATGGFLTHCGWNSTLEGVSAGVPMITWPMFAEQFYNEKLIVQVLKIGVRIGVEVTMQWGEEQNDGVYVMRDSVKNAINQLMDEGEKGQDIRKRAKELGEKAKKAVEKGGSSFLNVTSFIQHVRQ
ncbi:UDP-glycosyltransferase 73C3-like [Chenopodium quinoa]|uniref:UDP-glycosyltransferase 73C3-like n=1 Tax=Chenopodium quinoa TaxID=63459 RepID=UPI000B788595|nr:UDP-glycosyltransferase 73C3-like [Chenopodium quinoa]